jgi:hypothetical protein
MVAYRAHVADVRRVGDRILVRGVLCKQLFKRGGELCVLILILVVLKQQVGQTAKPKNILSLTKDIMKDKITFMNINENIIQHKEGCMDSPNHVLRAQEGMLAPKNDNPMLGAVKIAVWVIAAVIIVGSFIFKDNLFGNLAWTTRITFIVIVIVVCFIGGNKRIPSQFEVRFYNDYLVVYREKQYYNKKLSSMEYFKFFYKDIKNCDYDKTTQRMNIQGVLEATWYNYNTDGSLPANPTKQKTADSICYFYLIGKDPDSFISEFETHSPIKVNIL